MSQFLRLILTGLLLSGLLQPALAKKLYSYQDDSGRWHFSDTKPDVDQTVNVKRLKVHGRNKGVRVHRLGTRDKPVFQVQNLLAGPVEIEFQLIDGVNVITEPSLPRSFVVDGGTSIKAFTLRHIDSSIPWKYRYSYRVVLGSPEAEHAPTENYYLPYAHGKQYFVSQGFFGNYSHRSLQSQYAVDFAMPDGSAVHAARSGVVMDVARDFYNGGTDREKFGTRANYVRILHDDGTIALYAHLRWESVLVVPGDIVRRGQVIAKSGSTGFSSGPHLHFAIQKNDGMRLVSVPFVFKVADKAAPVTPRMGDLLTAD